MSSKTNEKYWRDRKINWKSHYWNLDHPHRTRIIEILKQHPVRSVLEVGCGCGANLYNIKKAFPEVKIAGCDINPDAIQAAKELFMGVKSVKGVSREYEENPIRKVKGETFGKSIVRGFDIKMEDIEFKVGNATELPFHGESFDLVLTDAFLLYVGPDKIERVLREMRRVGQNKFIFSELHDESWLGRLNLRVRERNTKFVYNYEKLLAKYYFKEIRLFKIRDWGVPLWDNYGYVITSLR